jgi:hypothetical protein
LDNAPPWFLFRSKPGAQAHFQLGFLAHRQPGGKIGVQRALQQAWLRLAA